MKIADGFRFGLGLMAAMLVMDVAKLVLMVLLSAVLGGGASSM